MMKRFINLLLTASIAFTPALNAGAKGIESADMSIDYKNVYLKGQADIKGEDIGILVTDALGSIEHIAQIKTDAQGKYEYKFKTDKDLTSGYTIKALCNEKDISQSIISASQETEMFSVSAEFDVNKINEKVIVNVQNKYADEVNAKALFVFYDSDGKMVNCTSEDIHSDFTQNNNIELIIPNVPENAKTLKVHLWESIYKMIPLDESLEKVCAPEFDTGKLFSVVPQTYEAEAAYAVDGVDAFYYQGADYHGNPTKVFAYFSLPEGASEMNKVPAVVFLHGGGGTAYPYWVKKWNEKGYAAIAMDLVGHTPDYKTHSASGPINTEYRDYATEEFEDQWMYQTVVNVIYANNLLRSMPEIDSDKIGISGISWGGVATSTTIGIDNRFAFAVPIYGCGYLFESSPRWSNLVQTVKNIWDPSLFFKNTTVPVCWVNSDHDPHFSLKAVTLSYQQVKEKTGNAVLSIYPDLGHGHGEPLVVEDIYNFADSIVNGEPSYIKITDISENNVQLDVPEGVEVSAVEIYTTGDKELIYKSSLNGAPLVTEWSVGTSASVSGNIIEYSVPDGTGMYYINITDSLGRTVSTGLISN